MGFGGGSAPDNRPPEFVREALSQQFQDARPLFEQYRDDPLSGAQQSALGAFRGQLQNEAGTDSLLGQANRNFAGFLDGNTLDRRVSGLGADLARGGINNPAAARVSGLASSQAINPFLDQQFQAAAGGVTDQFNQAVEGIRGNAALSGLRGTTALGRAVGDAETGLARGLSDLSANIYGQGYESAANRQLAATNLEAQLGQQSIQNRLAGAGLLDAGTQRQIQASQVAPSIAAAGRAPFESLLGLADYERAQEFLPFQQYQSIINPGLGVASFDRGGGDGSLLSNGLGGAAGGALIGYTAGGTTGALIGGGLGALGGLFS